MSTKKYSVNLGGGIRRTPQMSEVVLKSVEDISIGAIWGRMVFFSVAACTILHVAFAAVSCWSLFLTRPRFVLAVMLGHFAVAAIYSFLSTCIMSFAVAVVYYSNSHSEMTNPDMAVCVSIISAVTVFFAFGRSPTLYSL